MFGESLDRGMEDIDASDLATTIRTMSALDAGLGGSPPPPTLGRAATVMS